MQLHHALRLTLDPAQPDVIAIVGGGGKSSAAFRIALDLAIRGRRAVVTHTARIAAFQTAWSPALVEVAPDAQSLPFAAILACLDTHNMCLLTGPPVGDRRAPLSPHLVDSLAHAAPWLNLHAISIEADGSKMRPAKAPAEHEPVLPDATTLLAPMLGLDAVGGEITERLFHRAERVAEVLQDLQEVAGGGVGMEQAARSGHLLDVARGETAKRRFTPQNAAMLLSSPAGGAKARPPAARLLPIFNKVDHPLRLLYGRLAAARLAAEGQATLLTAVGAREGEPVRERWGQVATVILAAGAASRMGRAKQVEPVEGAPMLLRALRVAAALGGPVYVVTGAHRELVMALLDQLPGDLASELASELTGIRGAQASSPALGRRLHVIHNARWEEGQASSLHASIRALPAPVEAAIWLPVDQPFLEAALLAQLAATWRSGADLAAPSVDGELRGAPALFDRSRWPALLQVEGDSGGRAVLRRYAAEVATVATNAAMLRDVDSPHDLT